MKKFELKAKHISVETTTLCNANCVICPRQSFKRKKTIMRMNLFKKIVDDASQYQVNYMDLVGFGESLTDKLLFERMKYIKKKMPNVKIHMSNNGQLLTSEKHKNILKYVDILKFSIFATTSKTHKKIHRGSLDYETCKKNILTFLKAKGNKKLPHTIGLFVKHKENKHELKAWKRFWKKKFDEIMIWKPHNWIYLKNYRKFTKGKQISCGRPLRGPIFFFVNGQATICCLDINNKLGIGDIRKQTIAQIFRGKKYKRIRDKHLKRNFKGLVCDGCEQTKPKESDLIYANSSRRGIGVMLAGTKLKPKGVN